MIPAHLIVFGLGYSGAAISRASVAAGLRTTATSRDPARAAAIDGVALVAFDAAASCVESATHIVVTAPPGESGDPVLRAYGAAIAAAPALRWVGYLSTTGVYGDRGGGWVDEDAAVMPGPARAHRRVAAERDWAALSDRLCVDLFRTAGIYGPGRSALDDVRAGRARRVTKPGHMFGRIHRDDIAAAVLIAARQDRPPGARVLHLADDAPAESADVVAEAARLLGAPPPPSVAFEDAMRAMSEMGRGFWAENRKVANAKTKAALGLEWRYPSYREGLRAILAEEAGQGLDQERQIPGA